MRQPTVHLISLGCPRTLVDSELYLGELQQAGLTVVDTLEQADVAIINTCSFIQEAIQESIDTVLQVAELKQQGKLKAVVVAGCLVQRFKEGLVKELPEVDGFVGVDGFGDIETVVHKVLKGEHHALIRRRPRLPHRGQPSRVALTPSHYAYLKVSEGCLKGCSFCIIPKIKGPLASRPMEDLVEEARRLVEERGVRELVVVGQDTSDYGVDLYGQPRIADLLAALGTIQGLRWIRLLYCHPKGITPQILEAIRDIPTVCKYLDSAIEHADNDVLMRMNRGITQEHIRERVARLRREIPGISLRTAVIVGFPGETERAFEALIEFIEDMKFERLGAFQYSNEEGAAAFRYPDQVPEAVKQRRYDQLMQVQQRVASEINRTWLGRRCEVIIDEADPSEPTQFVGRTAADCPEVDGVVYVTNATPLVPGQIVPVTITDTYEYDLVAEANISLPTSDFPLPTLT